MCSSYHHLNTYKDYLPCSLDAWRKDLIIIIIVIIIIIIIINSKSFARFFYKSLQKIFETTDY